ncbi:MAG: secondary thiamine-phosphate synthase enzyme YjbQ [Sulfuriflexus sp.]|nr:secondary thiamine-phosphate synthase enzyme YjbQ [Sulfuriflexus sp.]
MVTILSISTRGQGLYNITRELNEIVSTVNIENGLCTVFVQHTSASLIIQENADPAVQDDLQNWFNRLVSENDPLYTHTDEGPDDMPAHIKSVLTATSIGIPIMQGRLVLGLWQGLYLWEHRRRGHQRSLAIHIQ